MSPTPDPTPSPASVPGEQPDLDSDPSNASHGPETGIGLTPEERRRGEALHKLATMVPTAAAITAWRAWADAHGPALLASSERLQRVEEENERLRGALELIANSRCPNEVAGLPHCTYGRDRVYPPAHPQCVAQAALATPEEGPEDRAPEPDSPAPPAITID